jgi:hypothetical protein
MSKLDKYLIDYPEAFEQDGHRFYRAEHPAVSYCYHVNSAFEKAFRSDSNLSEEMTVPGQSNYSKLPGMSGSNFRHLMNNIGSLKGANYLEVGVWKGSTLISTVYGNEKNLNEIHAIDNFSEFDTDGVVEKDFRQNLKNFLGDSKDIVNFHKGDSFSIDISELPKFDIFFYDGNHSEESQYLAFKYYESKLADTCIVIVDDWEQGKVRAGTRRGLEAIGYKVVSTWTLMPGKRPNNVNRVNNPTYDWWNGAFVAVITKELTNE